MTGYLDILTADTMGSELFHLWFKMVFLNCGVKRPVLLITDNHDSHTTLDLIECAREN